MGEGRGEGWDEETVTGMADDQVRRRFRKRETIIQFSLRLKIIILVNDRGGDRR